MKDGFEITGTEEIQKVLDELAPRHARNLMRSTVQSVASLAAKEAKKNLRNVVRKRTGKLEKAIVARRKKSHPDNPVSAVYVTKGRNAKADGWYWHFVEFGTVNMAESPYIRPAYDWVKSNHKKIMAEEFGKKLVKAVARENKKNGI